MSCFTIGSEVVAVVSIFSRQLAVDRHAKTVDYRLVVSGDGRSPTAARIFWPMRPKTHKANGLRSYDTLPKKFGTAIIHQFDSRIPPFPNGVTMSIAIGRECNGRFAKGNPGGPGNPYVARVAALRAVMMEAVTESDLRKIVAALIEKAQAGDVVAARELFDRCLGKPTAAVEQDGELQDSSSATDRGPSIREIRQLLIDNPKLRKYLEHQMFHCGASPSELASEILQSGHVHSVAARAVERDTIECRRGHHLARFAAGR
jgi:hypothetical protein